MDTGTKDLLPLDGERAISFLDKNKVFTFHFPRLTDIDWKRCFAGTLIDTEVKKREGGDVERVEHYDFNSPFARLAREKVKSVEGYPLTDGRDLMELANWRDRLPMGHLRHVGSQLTAVGEVKDDSFVLDPEFDLVRLEATWTSRLPGEMTKYSPLIHYFKPMTIEQQQRLMRARSQSIVVGGSRTGRTIYPALYALHCELYDELIAKVDGYQYSMSAGGLGLSGDVAREQMDAWHKVAAITVLTKDPDTQATETE